MQKVKTGKIPGLTGNAKNLLRLGERAFGGWLVRVLSAGLNARRSSKRIANVQEKF